MELYILTIIALIAGIVQGVTGFGAGIVMMMVLPMFYALPQSAGISGAISIILCATMVYTYREHIDLKKIVGPSFLYLIVFLPTSSITSLISKGMNRLISA